ncbi:MAG TPA: reactive intermediate/imine deaminase [Armatimonadetes bacterium]|jgi:reactive intermediate/imine deaminase|nr:reactive intermediate/imine deaminase [Armatimonadota bacterium]
MKKEVIHADCMPKPMAQYSQSILAEGSRLLFISGIVPFDSEGQLVGPGDLEAQSRRVFENMKAQLAAAGADFSNVVKVTIFIKGSEMGNFATFSKVRGEYLVEPYPAASAIGVECLVSPGMLIEVEAYAVLD